MTAKESGPGRGTGREGTPRRAKGGAPRVTYDQITDRFSAEKAALIKALSDLIDGRYASRMEFARAVAPARYRAFYGELSKRMGGDEQDSRKNGPRWEDEARPVVDTCCPPDRSWISEVARIAGLWARANEMARPLDYYGPVFPPISAEAPREHLDALTKGFPRASQPPRRCPYRDKRLARPLRMLAVLAAEAAVWAVAAFTASPGATGQRAVGLAFAGIWIITLAAFARPPRWRVPVRPEGAQMVCSPPQAPEAQMITELAHDQESGTLRIRTVTPRVMHPVPADAVPTRLGDTLTWRLEPGAAIVTPLVLGRWVPHWLSGLAGCIDGSLGIAVPADASGEQPRVEWALVDDDGRLHATGLLPPPPDGTGDAVTVLVPEYGQRWVIPLPLPAPAASAGEHTGPGTRYLEATLAGTLFWPWRWSQVNVVLRRLDTLPDVAHVRWRHAGLHMHRLTRKALSTTTSPPSRLDPAGQRQRYPVAAGSTLEVFTSGHEPTPDLPDPLEETTEVAAEPYEARGELTLLRLGEAVPLICDQCATRQTTPWIALRPGQHTATCRNCFLASHPATGEQGVGDPATSGASGEESLPEASSVPD